MSEKKRNKKSVLFMVPSPVGVSPSQRFRFEHYLPGLSAQGIRYKVSPYFTVSGRKVLYSSSNISGKIASILTGYLRRIGDLFRVPFYDFVYIHREAAPVGPPVFEWIIARVFRKKIIYDFDDSIWVPAMSEYNRRFLSIRFFSKVRKICSWSHRVTVGNEFLKSYADQFSQSVMVLPTVVNTEEGHHCLQDQTVNFPAIGWTGSFSTLPYLNLVLPALIRLQEKYEFTFYVIADKDPLLPLRNYSFIPWRRETETEDLLKFHIGLMPLTDDEITRGKCGFKAIQYMSLGMPALVSPVGVNTKIVTDGTDGYICYTEQDWEYRLSQLLENAVLRKQLGLAARNKIEEQYSVRSTTVPFLGIFS